MRNVHKKKPRPKNQTPWTLQKLHRVTRHRPPRLHYPNQKCIRANWEKGQHLPSLIHLEPECHHSRRLQHAPHPANTNSLQIAKQEAGQWSSLSRSSASRYRTSWTRSLTSLKPKYSGSPSLTSPSPVDTPPTSLTTGHVTQQEEETRTTPLSPLPSLTFNQPSYIPQRIYRLTNWDKFKKLMSAIEAPHEAWADKESSLALVSTLDVQLQKTIHKSVPWSKPCTRNKRCWTKHITHLKRQMAADK